jgi:hypothetical protein
MTKEQKKAAIVVALNEYADNLAAVQESNIPGGFDQLVRSALVKTLGDKFERIFDPPNSITASATAPASRGGRVAAKVAAKGGKKQSKK